ncbi:hypothetical protein [Nitrosomonas sp.]|uniref:hypothetical protein n=1 Tax=Nitrosomonas sp. TaxID=42353 RepID=UPI0025E8C2B8|nr:hypothetical protein [Nitrosomonas sp.]
MLRHSSTTQQPNFFGADLLMKLDPNDPLLKLASAIPWQEFEESFSTHYTTTAGVPSKSIRLMATYAWNLKQ